MSTERFFETGWWCSMFANFSGSIQEGMVQEGRAKGLYFLLAQSETLVAVVVRGLIEMRICGGPRKKLYADIQGNMRNREIEQLTGNLRLSVQN